MSVMLEPALFTQFQQFMATRNGVLSRAPQAPPQAPTAAAAWHSSSSAAVAVVPAQRRDQSVEQPYLPPARYSQSHPSQWHNTNNAFGALSAAGGMRSFR